MRCHVRHLPETISDDGAKFIMVNRLWFDLRERRVTAPPQALTDAMLSLSRTETFEQL